MKLKINLLILFIISFASCTMYNFVDGEAKYADNKSIVITQFDNNSGKGPPNMATTFTEKTKDYFMQNGDFTVLALEGKNDLKLECEITSYNVDYSGANGGESAQRYKLSIGVKVTFYDYGALKEEDKKITKNISNFDFFNPSQTLSDVEDELIEAISEKIITDIFTQTVTTTEW